MNKLLTILFIFSLVLTFTVNTNAQPSNSKINPYLQTVITSYSIHYTKLYDRGIGNCPGMRRLCGIRQWQKLV